MKAAIKLTRLSAAFAVASLATLSARSAEAAAGRADGPSFNCSRARSGTVEAVICSDAELSRLDLALARSFHDTVAAIDIIPAVMDMRIEHRRWLASRRDCLDRPKPAQRSCLADAYKLRLGRLSLWLDGTLLEEYR